jgi:hypothetical protein
LRQGAFSGIRCPYQNATGLQVTSAVLGGMVRALENPNEGIVEADEMDFDRLLEIQMPYLGPVKDFLHRLDAADRPAGPVPGRHRHVGSLAVQERAGAVARRHGAGWKRDASHCGHCGAADRVCNNNATPSQPRR